MYINRTPSILTFPTPLNILKLRANVIYTSARNSWNKDANETGVINAGCRRNATPLPCDFSPIFRVPLQLNFRQSFPIFIIPILDDIAR